MSEGDSLVASASLGGGISAPSTVIGDPRVFNINVGILGHVDSGKTSLVKALSTTLSTAALDKHPQSQQRGITLDLGFSAFTLPLPKRFHDDPLIAQKYDYLQFTLVDCPGHASLIRTIIGGAQIIDMIVLVIDVTKGIQTQTAECIVIGEITSDTVLIALNKIDLLPEDQREEKIEKMTRRIRKTLKNSKFAHAEIVPVSAFIGGEKVAAISSTTAASLNLISPSTSQSTSLGMSELVERITNTVKISDRDVRQPFYFAVDHCFAVKGHGTVLTGTVLSGSVTVNQVVELPMVQMEKKVKSMQMFRKNVKRAQQGDRVGICVTNLDPTTIERGFLCSPHSVPLVSAVICLVRKVRFCKLTCKSGSKIHVSLGHHTVLATATFFGADFLNSTTENSCVKATVSSQEGVANHHHNIAAYQQAFPVISYSPSVHYPYQVELAGSETTAFGEEPLQWALLQFPHPLYVPDHALVIGSRLDAEIQEHMCRLAFYGPVRYSFTVHAPSISTATTTTAANTHSNANRPHSNVTNNANSKGKQTIPNTIMEEAKHNYQSELSANPNSNNNNTVQHTHQQEITCPRISDRLINDHVHIYHLKHKECEVYRIVDQRRLVLEDLNANATTPVANTSVNISAASDKNSTKQKANNAHPTRVLSEDIHVFEIIVWKLVKEHASLTPFIGLKVYLPPTETTTTTIHDTPHSVIGHMVGMYDTDKLRVQFEGKYGAKNVRVGMKLIFPYKKYLYFLDSNGSNIVTNSHVGGGNIRHMVQSEDLFVSLLSNNNSMHTDAGADNAKELIWEMVLETAVDAQNSGGSNPNSSNAANVQKKKKAKKVTTASTAPDSVHSAGDAFVDDLQNQLSTTTVQDNGKFTNDSVNCIAINHTTNVNNSTSNISNNANNTSTTIWAIQNTGTSRIGKIETLKEDGSFVTAIVTGAFRMEENLKSFVQEPTLVSSIVFCTGSGQEYIPDRNTVEFLGPFGKLGKYKLRLTKESAFLVQVNDYVLLELQKE